MTARTCQQRDVGGGPVICCDTVRQPERHVNSQRRRVQRDTVLVASVAEAEAVVIALVEDAQNRYQGPLGSVGRDCVRGHPPRQPPSARDAARRDAGNNAQGEIVLQVAEGAGGSENQALGLAADLGDEGAATADEVIKDSPLLLVPAEPINLPIDAYSSLSVSLGVEVSDSHYHRRRLFTFENGAQSHLGQDCFAEVFAARKTSSQPKRLYRARLHVQEQ